MPGKLVLTRKAFFAQGTPEQRLLFHVTCPNVPREVTLPLEHLPAEVALVFGLPVLRSPMDVQLARGPEHLGALGTLLLGLGVSLYPVERQSLPAKELLVAEIAIEPLLRVPRVPVPTKCFLVREHFGALWTLDFLCGVVNFCHVDFQSFLAYQTFLTFFALKQFFA